MENESKIKIIKELLGDIEPYGDTYIDNKIMKDLEVWNEIYDYITNTFTDISCRFNDDNRYSVCKIACNITNILIDTRENIEKAFDEVE